MIDPLRIEAIAARAHDPAVRQAQELDTRCFHAGERTDIAAECDRPFTSVWLAIHRTNHNTPHVVGYLVAWHVADELHILNIATDPDHRRCGVGRRLITHAITHAREHEVRLMLLEVRKSNLAALELYRSVGFACSRTRPGYYTDNDEDAVEMELNLNAITRP